MLPIQSSSSSGSLGRSTTRASAGRYRQVDVEVEDAHEQDMEDDEDVEAQPPIVPPRVTAPATAARSNVNELPMAEEIGGLSTDEASRVVMAQILPSTSSARIPTATATPAAAPQEERFVNIKTVDDRTVRVPLRNEGITLREFRRDVERATGVATAQQRLIMNGRLLCVEDEPLQLEQGAYLHLVPLTDAARRQHSGSDGTSASSEGDEVEYLAESRIQREFDTLQLFAWGLILVFGLVSWRFLMNLVFDDDPDHNPLLINCAKLFMSLFGLYVGTYGARLVAASRAMRTQAGGTTERNVAETRVKVRRYILYLSMLSLMILLSMLQAMQLDQNTFMTIMIYQTTFWFCIFQAQATHRALRSSQAHVDEHSPRTVEPVEMTRTTSIDEENAAGPTVVLAVPSTTGPQHVQPSAYDAQATEMTVFASSTLPPNRAQPGDEPQQRVIHMV